ncbi:hypothetical protein KNP414_01265 [Paenibacillus mucilaginosus KNP414]|uniref:Uncharacterized protein n=1 Tax=Paenibacillus mucilaginosus (strain KNP414) TaxID=1036673 RepID=F8FHC8_PAEMK|nr:hypothetical protein KNP414_01265 [Paenibacillus mucilaginosus KNP414]
MSNNDATLRAKSSLDQEGLNETKRRTDGAVHKNSLLRDPLMLCPLTHSAPVCRK